MCKYIYVSMYVRKKTQRLRKAQMLYTLVINVSPVKAFISTKLCKLRLYIHSLFAYSMTWEEKYHFSFLLLVSTVMTSKP